MKHTINPATDLRPQLLALGFTDPHPRHMVALYRFFAPDGALLYIGISIRPMDRWQKHKRRAAWWPLVGAVTVEWHPTERTALDAEDAAIKAEHPAFNVRSVPRNFMQRAAIAHTLLMSNVPLSLSLSRSTRRSVSRRKNITSACIVAKSLGIVAPSISTPASMHGELRSLFAGGRA